MTVNGKLLAGHALILDDHDGDQTSVCSCNCLGLNHYDNHHVLLESSYHPPSTILSANLKTKRASV